MLAGILYDNPYTKLLLFIVIATGCTVEWFRLMKKAGRQGVAKFIFPFIYFLVPMCVCFVMSIDNPVMLLCFFAFVWINDIMAFVVGSIFGKHKIFPRYSPSKTWEGTIGGVVFTIGAGVTLSLCFGDSTGGFSFFKPNVLDWVLLSGLIAVASVFGDLVESIIKRKAGVKDSGKIMPGHGGFLDRFDSILFAIPTAYLYIIFSLLLRPTII
jgi:phosphatidate cytidylyltransferase